MQLDTTRFPLVFMREAEQQPSAAGTPEQALEALLDRGERFVLLTDHMPGDRAIPAAARLAAQGAGKVLGLAIAFVETERDAIEAASRWLAKAEGAMEG